MSVRVYVEGGGHQKRTRTACRRGFSRFFSKAVPPGSLPRIIAAGDRRAAFDDFRAALDSHRDDFVVLLVDSESAVPGGTGSWAHLKARDGWDRPDPANDDHAHLMVQCMEAWFLADRVALQSFYGEGFLANSLPGHPNIEVIPKGDVLHGLEHATIPTQKGVYHKTKHGFDLLASLDTARVRDASPYARRLLEVLVRETAFPSGAGS